MRAVRRCAGGDFKLLGQALLGDDEGVVAGAGHRRGNAGEDGLAVVGDLAGLAVHQLRRADDVAAKGRADGLVPQTHAEDRNARASILRQQREVLDQRNGYARVLRGAGAGRDEDAGWSQRLNFARRQLIVAADEHLRAQLAHVLDQVVGEGVVVV